MKTYDIVFNNNESSDDKGFARSIEDCRQYIDVHKKLKDSYCEDYTGGTVSIVCNETGETVYSEDI